MSEKYQTRDDWDICLKYELGQTVIDMKWLKVATSGIPNSGLGLFAAQDLEINDVIDLYIGVMLESPDVS